MILFASKGGKPFSTLYSDVIGVPNLKNRVHAAQKPVKLYRPLITRNCLPGDPMLDPCCGSGTIFRAAALTKTIATGIELDEDAQGMSLIAIQEIEGALTK